MIFIFECKKVIHNRLVVIAFLFAVILNAVATIAYIQEFSANEDNVYSIQHEEYNEALLKTIQRAYGNLDEYESQNIPQEAYTYRYQKEIIARYDTLRVNVHFTTDEVIGWAEYFRYTIADLISIVMVILLSTVVFVQDTKIGFHIIQKTTKKGKAATYFQKLLLIFILLLFTVVILLAETGLLFQILYGFGGMDNAIQVISDYLYCPYSITVGEAFILLFLLKIVTLMLFSAIVITIGVFLHSYSIPWIVGILFTGVIYVLSKTSGNNWFNPINVMTGKSVFLRYQSVNLFNILVDNIIAIILAYIFLIFILCVISYYRYTKSKFELIAIDRIIIQNFRHITKNVPSSCKRRVQNKKYSLSIFRAEMYKLLISNYNVIFILLFLFVKLICVNTYSAIEDTTGNLLYKEYMEVLSGELTVEKEQYIYDERIRLDDILSQKDNMKEMYDEGNITRNEYSIFLSEYYETEEKNKQFVIIEEQFNAIKQKQEEGNSDIEPWFVYDTGWKKLMQMPLEWNLWIVIIILFSGIFAKEYQQGSFADIMRTTFYGRLYTYTQKYKLAIIGALLLSIIWYSIEIIWIFHMYDMPMSNAPVQSISDFRMVKYGISIGGYTVIQYFIRMLYAVLLASIVTSVSEITKKSFSCVAIVMILSAFPMVLAGTGIYEKDTITFLRYFSGSINMENTVIGIVVTGCYIICAIILNRISKIQWCGIRKEKISYDKL